MRVANIPDRAVYKCDRCGAEGEMAMGGAFKDGSLQIVSPSRYWWRTFEGDLGLVDVNVDLCCECAISFKKWLFLIGMIRTCILNNHGIVINK